MEFRAYVNLDKLPRTRLRINSALHHKGADEVGAEARD